MKSAEGAFINFRHFIWGRIANVIGEYRDGFFMTLEHTAGNGTSRIVHPTICLPDSEGKPAAPFAFLILGHIFPEFERYGYARKTVDLFKETTEEIIADRVRGTAKGFWEKRRVKMKKIIIKTDCPEADNMLLACIRYLFPECEMNLAPFGRTLTG